MAELALDRQTGGQGPAGGGGTEPQLPRGLLLPSPPHCSHLKLEDLSSGLGFYPQINFSPKQAPVLCKEMGRESTSWGLNFLGPAGKPEVHGWRERA